MPSTLTCRSSIDSSRADWVFGEARLISSPTTMLAKMPPGLNSNSRVSALNTETPVMSEGSRSGVNCSRRTEQSIDRPSALASIVLPTPGTSSTSRWPSASSTTRARSTELRLPSITVSIGCPDPAHHLDDIAEGIRVPLAVLGEGRGLATRAGSLVTQTHSPSDFLLPRITLRGVFGGLGRIDGSLLSTGRTPRPTRRRSRLSGSPVADEAPEHAEKSDVG